MSQDRKPARVRVTSAGADAQQRRRHDTPPVVVDGAAPQPGRAAPAAKGGKARLLVPALFLLGAGIGGTAMAVLGFA